MPTNSERLTLSDHPRWPEAEAELRAVLEHMSIGIMARRTLTRQAGSEIYPRALLAAVAIALAEELVSIRPPLESAQREAVAEACYAAGDRLAASGGAK